MSVNYIEAEELVRLIEDWIREANATEDEIFYPDVVPQALAQVLGDHITMCKAPSEVRKWIIELIDERVALRQKSGTRLKAFALGYTG